MRFLIPLVIMAVCVLAAPSANAGTYGCPPFVMPRITVTPLLPPLRYDDNASLAEIRQLSGQARTTYSGLHQVPVGLTVASIRVASNFEVSSQPMPGEQMYCSRITQVNLEFGFDDTVVYLAREMERPSCAYYTVLAHEHRHVEADQRLMAAALPQLQGLLALRLKETGVIRASSAPAAEAQYHAVVNAFIRELSANIAGERERIQMQIDTPEEYKRLSASCDGEIARLARDEMN